MPEGSSHQDECSPSCPHCRSPRVVLVPAPAGRQQTVWWVLAVLLAVIATSLVSRRDAAWISGAALAQMSGSGAPSVSGARGIYAFTGQLGLKDYGLFMIDVDTGTVWCYQMARSRDGELQLQLVAARSWIFDRFLEEFNVARPTPSEVQLMVRQQRGHAQAAGGLGVPPGGGLPLPALPATQSGSDEAPFTPALPDAN